MYELPLYAGAGGGLLGTYLIGGKPIGYVEKNDYCQRVIAARIRDGFIPNAPIFGNIETFISDGYAASYTGLVDLVTAGWPCQPHSLSGKRRGADDERDMWPATAETIRIVKPRWFLGENVPGILSTDNGRYWGGVLRDLAEMGYNAKWGVFSACASGAPHARERVFIVAYPKLPRREIVLCNDIGGGGKANSRRQGFSSNPLDAILCSIAQNEESLGEPSVFGTSDGVAYRVDRLGAVGNGQVPAVVRRAWRVLSR